ncbi:MAG: hypothetical protein QXT77_07830 [Candidatus Methanomethylicaceae archaeon]
MSRRSKSRAKRGASVTATRLSSPPPPRRVRWPAASPGVHRIVRVSRPTPHEVLAAVLSDNREWHPEGRDRPVRATRRPAARLVVPSPLHDPAAGTKARIMFADPARVDVCARRSIRRQVLFALGKAGRNGQKTRRMRPESSISCRG